MSRDYELKLVDSLSEFKALQVDWNDLYENSNHCTVFSSWDWVFTWWEVFHDQFTRQLFILCLYDKDKLVGIAPFQIDKSYPRSLIQGKTLRFIGSGDAYEDRIVSQFQDFIVLPEVETFFIKRVSEYLTIHKEKWDFADFEFLLDDALILQCYVNSDDVISRSIYNYGVRFLVRNFENFEDFQNKMGKRWQKMFIKKSRILARDGKVSIKSIDTKESIDTALKLLADMNCSRWKERAESCVFESSRFYDFHQKILHRLVPQGKASIKTLVLEEESLASYYLFEDKEQVHYYQSGFYSKYANRYSPLFLLVCNEIGEAINANKVFDFMYDDSSQSYKKEQYAASHEIMYRLKWTPQPLRLSLFNYAKTIKTNGSSFCTRIKNKIKAPTESN